MRFHKDLSYIRSPCFGAPPHPHPTPWLIFILPLSVLGSGATENPRNSAESGLQEVANVKCSS